MQISDGKDTIKFLKKDGESDHKLGAKFSYSAESTIYNDLESAAAWRLVLDYPKEMGKHY